MREGGIVGVMAERYLSDRVASYDLHLHTCWSYDGASEVEAVFAQAQAAGVGTIAITDHHNMDAYGEVVEVAQRYPGVRVIAGAELTVTTRTTGGAVDLLCYGLPVEPTGKLAEVLAGYRAWQQRAGAALSAGLVALGYAFDDETRLALLRSYRPGRTIDVQGATHVKNGVLRDYVLGQGWARDEAEYGRLMSEARRCGGRCPYPDVGPVVEAVHEAGGVVAIAHPMGYFKGADRTRMDALREECALDGIECAHTRVDPALGAEYEGYCAEHGLLCVAGSDGHDEAALKGMLGRHGGKEAWVEALMERVKG